MLPAGRPVLWTGDRFSGRAALIRWGGKPGWQYRLRRKDNLILPHEGGTITTGEAATAGMTSLLTAVLHETGVKTHSGILHEKGHQEPWIIARSETPCNGRVLDDGMRWGMEPLFSDCKSRGFGIAQTPYGLKAQMCSVWCWRNVRKVGVTLLLQFIEGIDSIRR